MSEKDKNIVTSFKKEEWEILEGNSLRICGPSLGEYVLHLEKNNRTIFLAHPGDWIKNDHFKKHSKIYFKNTLVPEIFNRFTTLLQELKNAQAPEEFIIKSKSIISFWNRTFLQDGEKNFWNFLIALHNELYLHDTDMLENLNDFAVPVYQRSFHLAGYVFLIALKNGIYDWDILQEMYLVSLNIDCGLASSEFHTDMYYALELDRKKIGDGKNYLETRGHSENDVIFYLNHSQVSYEIFLNRYSKKIKNPRIAQLIQFHHEGDLTAYPKGLQKFECDESEMIIILLNRCLPYLEHSEYVPTLILESLDESLKQLKISYLKAVA